MNIIRYGSKTNVLINAKRHSIINRIFLGKYYFQTYSSLKKVVENYDDNNEQNIK